MEADDTGLDIFGEHVIRPEDVGPLILGPPTQIWNETHGASPRDPCEDLSVPILDQHSENALSDNLFVPSGLNCRLRDYQREGVRFLYNLWASAKGGVLADDMGLGKTVQTVAFLGAVLRSPVNIRKAQHEKKPLVVLIVCPTSVITNWESELRKWGEEMGKDGYSGREGYQGGEDENDFGNFGNFTNFSVAKVHGETKKEQWARVLATVEIAMDGATQHAAVPANVALTSYDTFRLNIDDFKDINWTACVFDEAHKLKNEKTAIHEAAKQLKDNDISPRIGLTGTIMQNTYEELWSLMDWACKHSLGEAKYFKEHYSSTMQQAQRFGAGDAQLGLGRERARQLKVLLKKYVLSRKKKDVLAKSLPTKADNVVFCELSPLQLRVYQRLLDTPEFQLLARCNEDCDCDSGETRAKCCYRVPGECAPLWEAYHKDLDGNQGLEVHEYDRNQCKSCPYCLCLPCMSILAKVSNHLELIKPDPTLVQQDPEKFYRKTLVATMALGEDAHLLGDAKGPDGDFVRISSAVHCGKLLALEKLLKLWHAQNDKVLIFSVSTRLLTILETFMTRRGYVFSRLDGSTGQKHRQNVVDDFNKSQGTFVFLLSTKAGGAGLNIVSANRVVIFDPNWNPALDLQAQDRSYRIGQKKDVDVYRFLTSGTLEELVYQRQVYKQQQSNVAVEGIEESRFFDGVQGDKGNKGELFGITNIFAKVAKGEEVRMKKLVEREREANDVYRIEKARDKEVVPEREDRRGSGGAGGAPSAAAAATAAAVEEIVRGTGNTSKGKEPILPGRKEGVLHEHRHDMLVGRATEAEHVRSVRAVEEARERGELDGPGQPGKAAIARAEKGGKGKRKKTYQENVQRWMGDEGEDGPRTANRAANVNAHETDAQRVARDADAVVAALATREGVSVAEMGNRLLSGNTGDRASKLREFLVAKGSTDTSLMIFH